MYRKKNTQKGNASELNCLIIDGTLRLIESMMGLRPRQGNLRLVFRLLFSLMRGLPNIRLK